MIEDWIQKVRKAFFQVSSVYTFQGSLNPAQCHHARLCSPYPPTWLPVVKSNLSSDNKEMPTMNTL